MIDFGGGFDPNAMNYGGGSSDNGSSPLYDTMGNATGFDTGIDPNSYGYFKEGGSFTVRGDGGTDTSLVKIHATRGERVTVTPSSIAMPKIDASSSSNGNSAQQQSSDSSTTTNKIVNIHVQAGIQADSFIRSRAQIARGI